MVDSINPNLLPKSFYDPQTQSLTVDQKQAQAVQSGIQARLDQLPPAEQQAFLQMTANLAPGDVNTPGKLDAVLDAFASAAELVGTPGPVTVFVGDIASFLARAMIEAAAEQKQNALDDRLAAREQARADLLDQAKSMQDAADKMAAGAMTSLITSVVGGALSIAGSFASAAGGLSQIKNMTSAVKAGNQVSEELGQTTTMMNKLSQLGKSGTLSEAEEAAAPELLAKLTSQEKMLQSELQSSNNAFQLASGKSQVWSAGGQTAGATGDMTRGIGQSQDTTAQADAKRADAEGAKDAAQAQYDQQVADGKKQVEDSLDDMIKQIIDFLKQLKDAEAEAMRSLTRV